MRNEPRAIYLVIVVRYWFDRRGDCRRYVDFNCFHLGFVLSAHTNISTSTYEITRGHILIKCRLDLVLFYCSLQPSNQRPVQCDNTMCTRNQTSTRILFPSLALVFWSCIRSSVCRINMYMYICIFICLVRIMINEISGPKRFFFLRKSMGMRDPDLSISIILLRQQCSHSLPIQSLKQKTRYSFFFLYPSFLSFFSHLFLSKRTKKPLCTDEKTKQKHAWPKTKTPFP